MCLYPKLILNRRYLPSKKNGGVTPVCTDERLRYVTAECGDCYECRRQKQRQWQVRMQEELRENPNAYFMTLTIDDKSFNEERTGMFLNISSWSSFHAIAAEGNVPH